MHTFNHICNKTPIDNFFLKFFQEMPSDDVISMMVYLKKSLSCKCTLLVDSPSVSKGSGTKRRHMAPRTLLTGTVSPTWHCFSFHSPLGLKA